MLYKLNLVTYFMVVFIKLSDEILRHYQNIYSLCNTVKNNSRITPSSLRIDIGNDVTFSCNTWDPPKWYHNTFKTEPMVSGGLTNELVLNNLHSQNGGDYYCYGSYHEDSHFFLAKATLKVYSKNVLLPHYILYLSTLVWEYHESVGC